VTAPPADKVNATGIEATALEVGIELLDDESRQPAGLLGALAEGGPVLGHRLVQHGVFGPAASVAGGASSGGCEGTGDGW
jgi:hypothetical protein